MYEKLEIRRHKKAAEKLDKIKENSFEYIKKNLGKIDEYDVKEFILKELEKEEMISDEDFPIVACNENTGYMHYFPIKGKSKKIGKDCLIMIDIWARLNEGGYFADITWMLFTGEEVPNEIKKTFGNVIKARDLAVDFIREKLKEKKIPKGVDVDLVVRKFFNDDEKFFIHGLGHSLGYYHAHGGLFILNKKCDKKIQIGVPFTIEPGLYYESKFGIRSEIDCYIDEDLELVISTGVQKEILLIS